MEGPPELEDEEVIDYFIENKIKDKKEFIKELFCTSWETDESE